MQAKAQNRSRAVSQFSLIYARFFISLMNHKSFQAELVVVPVVVTQAGAATVVVVVV